MQLVRHRGNLRRGAENARRLQWLEQENQRLMTEITLDRSLIGESPRMKEISSSWLASLPPKRPSSSAVRAAPARNSQPAPLIAKSPRANKPFMADQLRRHSRKPAGK